MDSKYLNAYKIQPKIVHSVSLVRQGLIWCMPSIRIAPYNGI